MLRAVKKYDGKIFCLFSYIIFRCIYRNESVTIYFLRSYSKIQKYILICFRANFIMPIDV